MVSEIDNQEVVILVYNIATGKEMGRGQDTVKKGETKWCFFSDLQEGSYQVVLQMKGVNMGVIEFNVIRE